jgi:iron(III) transport system ATP-binding protein
LSAASIEFQGVVKRYGQVTAVDGIHFKVAAGELVTLLGPSGCGKTTTLRMIAGLELPSEGKILIGGQDVSDMPASGRDVSMVFQSYALFPHMTVLENVSYGLTVSGQSKEQATRKAQEVMQTVGLNGFDHRLPSELSGGQQQRVAVARALVLEPSVLLFDEPLSNLDARLRRSMRDDIRDLQQRLGLTVVYVTHDQAEAMAISDRIIVMNKARIAQEGRPHDLYRAPLDSFVAAFMGEANLLPAKVLALPAGDHGLTTVSLGDGRETLELSFAPSGLGFKQLETGQMMTVAVRPEAVMVELESSASGLGMKGTIRKSSYLGAWVEYTVNTVAGEVFAVERRLGEPLLPPGTAVTLTFRGPGVMALT